MQLGIWAIYKTNRFNVQKQGTIDIKIEIFKIKPILRYTQFYCKKSSIKLNAALV